MDVATQTPGDQKAIPAPTKKLEDQAATAALYVTNSPKKQAKDSNYPLDKDNKLSSAGAATSLKYANPRDLPSFPSTGITNKDSSAGAAASLANANHKQFEYWKPESSAPANRAAMLAKDYQAAPLWHPEMSAAGSKAAILAAKHGADVSVWRPEATAAGNSAAGQAMRKKNLSPEVDYGYTADGSSRALLAATGAMSGRKRSGSSPIVRASYPDQKNSAANALNAATVANRPKDTKSPLGRSDGLSSPIDAARIHNAAITNLGREMYTSHPPVAPEVEEKNRQAALRASAVVMAKQMYEVQQKVLESHAGAHKSDSYYAANSSHRRESSIDEESVHIPASYPSLQAAAQKLAAERLAKLGPDKDAEYRAYYGASIPSRSSGSLRGRLRRRASSDGEVQDSDEARSRQIRQEMSIFNTKIAQIDEVKRKKDREALLAAAQRNVAASMHGMDERIFQDTGKASPAMKADWEAKARAKAEADSSARMANHGKVHIGGGKYIDQSEVDAIAAARVQPTLDEITAKAEAQRAREDQLRKEDEERRRVAEEKAAGEKERSTKTKEEWKRFKEEEKAEQKAKKEEEKARKEEEKARKAEEKRKSKVHKEPLIVPVVVTKDGNEEDKEQATPILEPVPHIAPISTAAVTKPLDGNDSIISDTRPEMDRMVTAPESVPLKEEVESPVIEDREKNNPFDTDGRKDLESLDLPKHEEEVTDRIAPPPVVIDEPSKTEGEPASMSKPRESHYEKSTLPKPDSGKLSSWFKNKFSRHSGDKDKKGSNALNAALGPHEPVPETITHDPSKISTPTEDDDDLYAASVDGTTDRSTHRESATPGAESAREVAMVGRPEGAAATTTSDHQALSSHPPAATRTSRSRSTSISTLSSDEPTTSRGRTPLRSPAIPSQPLSPTSLGEGKTLVSGMMGHPIAVIDDTVNHEDAIHLQPAAESTESRHEEGLVVRSEGKPSELARTSTSGEADDFEEAKDQFEEGSLGAEGLEKPKPGFMMGILRPAGSGSPVRDSRFVENL
ncbi:MAG: hypothetical protein MMC33_000749 [Icmadophila ericetorum]|nr:hypothetical protein [Icmadophila ericetorum]